MSQAATFAGNALLHPLAGCIRRRPGLWVFGAPNGRFEGNSKYLFLWLSMHRHQPAPIWITTDEKLAARLRKDGFQAHWQRSARGLMAAARAGVYFVNDNSSDVNFGLSNGSKIFNLWHGVGLKNVMYGSKVGTSASLRSRPPGAFTRIRNMRRLQRPDFVLSTSPEMSKSFFSRCFAVSPDRAPALGYPRLDPQLDENLKQAAIAYGEYPLVPPLDIGSRAILYAPTLREGGRADFLARALPDLQQLSASLRAHEAHLYLKLHPKMSPDRRWSDQLPANISMLPADMDLYPVLDRFAALVTDYSSLFFDFIAFRSAAVTLYAFDLDEYEATERDLAWDYGDATVGVRANSFAELCGVIADGAVFRSLEPAKLAELRTRFWGGDLKLPTACERIRDFVLAQQQQQAQT